MDIKAEEFIEFIYQGTTLTLKIKDVPLTFDNAKEMLTKIVDPIQGNRSRSSTISQSDARYIYERALKVWASELKEEHDAT